MRGVSVRNCRGSRAILPVSARTGADRIPAAGRPAEVAGPARVCDHALVSMTTTITVGERGFWATKDAFGAWMGYLVEEIADRAPVLLDPALSALAGKWRVAALVTDFGADAGELSDEQRSALRAIAAAARARAETVGDLSTEQMRQWIILDDDPVAGGWAANGILELARILEVADGFIALLENRFPPNPSTGAWLLGTGDGYQVVRYRPEALTKPRWPRNKT
jgi:hypothetical protein